MTDRFKPLRQKNSNAPGFQLVIWATVEILRPQFLPCSNLAPPFEAF